MKVVTKHGCTALYYAAANPHNDGVECVLSHGLGINYTSHCDGQSALHIATLKGSPEVYKLLLRHGAAVNINNKGGNTPLI